mgnify:CR=1 FL=1
MVLLKPVEVANKFRQPNNKFKVLLNHTKRRVNKWWLKPSVEILAGVPTVVYGYVALVFVTPLLQALIPDLAAFNALAPGLVMGLMIVPTIASLSEDAIRSVPVSLREASFGLGVGRVATIWKVVLPSALRSRATIAST